MVECTKSEQLESISFWLRPWNTLFSRILHGRSMSLNHRIPSWTGAPFCNWHQQIDQIVLGKGWMTYDRDTNGLPSAGWLGRKEKGLRQLGELASVPHTAQPPVLLPPPPPLASLPLYGFFLCSLQKMKVPKSFLHASVCACVHAHVCAGESNGLG